MPDYFYDMDLVVDPLNPSNVVAMGSVAIYDPADTAGTTLLALKDPSGLPLPNPLTSNANGFLPPRIASVPQTLWKSGGFEGYFNSFKGLRDEAVSAVAAAQGAADAATTAVAEVVTTAAVDGAGALVLTKANGSTVNAGNVKGGKGDKGDTGAPGVNGSNVLPTDTAIKNAITTPGTETATALSATIDTQVSGAITRPAGPRTPRPLVVFSFDDGPINDKNQILPVLTAKGIKATFAIISSKVGTAGHLSWADLNALIAAGHEIADHSTTHASLSGSDPAIIAAEVDASAATFLANGIKPEGFVWPFAASSPASRAAARKYYRYGLGGAGGTTQPFHTYAILRVGTAGYAAKIDAAIANNELLIFLQHSATMDAAAHTELAAAIDYAKASAASIVTAGEAFRLVGNVVDVGDLPGATSYTVVDGQGRLKTSGVDAYLVKSSVYNLSSTAIPSSFEAGKITYHTLNAPGNVDWPTTGGPGAVITNRIDGTNAVYAFQHFISNAGYTYSRRALDANTWRAWMGGPPAAPPVEYIAVSTVDTITAATTPGSFAANKITYSATSGTANTDWPVTGTNGLIETNRLYTSSPSYIWQKYTSDTGVLWQRRALDANTWKAWVKAGPA